MSHAVPVCFYPVKVSTVPQAPSLRLSDNAPIAADLGVDAVAPVPAPDITRAVAYGFMSHADRIRTKASHGLSREVHKAPCCICGNHEVLLAGTVYTDEPGLYETGKFRVRIEDDVLVTDDGCQTLTHFPKELMVLPC